MVYVALLRGINVGGKSRVEMSRLKQVFAGLGCTDISTYINSGNVIFRDVMPAAQLAARIQHKIAQEFGFEVPVILRDLPAMQQLNEFIPASWTNDDQQRTNVLFLWDHINEASILTKIKTKPEIEDVRYTPGAIIWNTARKDITRGSASKLVQNELYPFITIRNLTTVQKLYALMRALSA